MGADLHKVFNSHTMFCIDVGESTNVGLVAKLKPIHMLHNPVLLGGLAFLDFRVFPVFKPVVHKIGSRKGAKTLN